VLFSCRINYPSCLFVCLCVRGCVCVCVHMCVYCLRTYIEHGCCWCSEGRLIVDAHCCSSFIPVVIWHRSARVSRNYLPLSLSICVYVRACGKACVSVFCGFRLHCSLRTCRGRIRAWVIVLHLLLYQCNRVFFFLSSSSSCAWDTLKVYFLVMLLPTRHCY